MIPQIYEEHVARPSSLGLDNVKGHIFEQVFQHSSDSYAMALDRFMPCSFGSLGESGKELGLCKRAVSVFEAVGEEWTVSRRLVDEEMVGKRFV